MAEDYYSDGAADAAAPDAKESAGEKPTALLPKSFFPDGDPQPGKVYQVKVDKVYDDEVSITYSHADEPEEEVVEEVPEPFVAPEGEMSGYMG